MSTEIRNVSAWGRHPLQLHAGLVDGSASNEGAAERTPSRKDLLGETQVRLAPDRVKSATAARSLKITAVRRTASEVLLTAKTQGWTTEEVLRTLVETELAARDASNVVNRLKAAGFPLTKTLKSFDVAASSVQPKVFNYLSSLNRFGDDRIWRSRTS